MRIVLFCTIFFIFSQSIHSAEVTNHPDVKENEKQLILESLSHDKTWLTLLGFANRNTYSDILSKEFFLASDGRKNPFAELVATIDAFTEPVSSNPNEHAQCRYRGRYVWLDSKINLSDYGVTQHTPCPAYLRFSNDDTIESVSLMFASGYFGNPASFYGHLLLKFNTPEFEKSDLEDYSVNFGAIYPPTETIPVYILKGLFGGYKATYTHQEFYQRNLNYGELDLRDLWEYELNLSASEVELVTAHTWELIGSKYRYYFFNRNCAYQLGILIQVITEAKLVGNRSLWQIPQSLMQNLSNTEHDENSLVKNVIYHPSRQSRLYQRYSKLSLDEKKLTTKIIRSTHLLNSDEFQMLSVGNKQNILDVLLDYYKYASIRKKITESEFKKNYNKILSERFLLPAGDEKESFSGNSPPHNGRRPSYISFEYSYSDEVDFTNLRIRPAFYDSLDYGSGHTKNSSLSMGELNFKETDGEIKLESIGIVSIESLSRNLTRLPGDRRLSWFVSSGIENDDFRCDDCYSFKLNGGYGFARSYFRDRAISAIFLGGGYFGDSFTEEDFHITPRFVTNIDFSQVFRVRFEAKQDFFIKDIGNEPILKIDARFELSTNRDLRFGLEDNGELLGSISFGYYW